MAHYVIVGSPEGIGFAIAKRLAAEGHRLHLIGRNEDAVRASSEALHATFDIADVMDIGALEKAIVRAGTAIDGLCYAAGTINLKPFGRLTRDDFLRDFEVNALCAAFSVQAALPALKASTQANAAVLLFSSIAAAQGFTAHASIGMAKAAVEGLVKSLAAELAPKIRVNAIAPSLTRTNLAKAMTDNANLASTIASLHPLQRIGEAEDIAALGALLLTPQSSWITGQVIGIDGGRSTLRTKG